MSTECRHSGAHCEAKGRSRRLCLPSRTRAFVKICRHSLLMRLLLPPHLLLPSLSLSLHPSVYVSVSVLCFSQQHQDIPQIEIRLFPHQNYQIEIRVFQIKQFRWKFYINHHKKNTIPMLFIEDLLPLLWSSGFREKARFFKESLLQSMANTSCESSELEASCRDESSALVLKLIAVVSILIAGVVGVAIPLVGKNRRFLRTDSSLFVAAKAFAAGVILATGFVHMLNGGSEALNNPCLPEFPWAKFPFSGFFAMMASLATLLVDFVATQYYERKQGLARPIKDQVRVGSDVPEIEAGVGPGQPANDQNGKVFGEEEGGGMHIVGMHAHAAHHGHSHQHGQAACDGHVAREPELEHGHDHGHGHSHGFGDADEDSGARHVVVSQILELGIVSHSVIIGLSLGVSQSTCTIRPLIAALSFHQFFEGFALGGCISQAQIKTLSATLMACFFAITTPLGIGVGTAISSFYNPYSTGALITEGILDSLSAGILVYMALVDLIAADFLSKRMSCNFRLQVVSYCCLFVGAGLMSLLAIWA